VRCSVLQCVCVREIDIIPPFDRQRVAVCCSVLQRVAVCVKEKEQERLTSYHLLIGCVLQCVAVCCSVLQCVAACCSVLQCDTVC